MSPARIVLASASPARLRLLQAAGIDPEVMVSGVDEDDVDRSDAGEMVAVLARRKALAVAARCGDGFVVAADSALEIDGAALGKPHTSEEATLRWQRLRGRAGALVTGHHLIDAGSGRSACGVARTVVHFADLSDAEVAAYVSTGEPLEVAGAFTLDGYGAAFVERVEGEVSNVVGLSIPLLRRLFGELGVAWTTLWR